MLLRTLGEFGDPISRPGDTPGHPADGPIDDATALRLDRGPDLGLAGPPAGGPLGYLVPARPRGDGRAVGHRHSELGFPASWSLFRHGIH
jgi:hypothetical protein